ncbi:leucine-rich repeat-containing protein 63 [Ahaetulla prasina]|uniref:leucine-rich repeat-containing protein 63 n=1 Tax=Ahaetulla prasina TaxID=499056 RepID=UPI002649EADA|nr:leucine-rich repeat-containing protein 63 [Ahaetulla prasina]
MSQLQLLRRPLSPKMEPEQYILKKKCTKGVREKEKEPEKVLGGVDSQPEKSQPISLCFPDDDFGAQLPGPLKRNFVIPVYLTGPPSFPMQNRRAPMRLQHPTLHPFHLPSDFVVSGVTMVTSPLRSVIQKSVPKKPFISHYNCEVFSKQLIAKEMKGPEKVSTIYLKLGKSDGTLESPEKSQRSKKSPKSMWDEEQIMQDEEQIMLDREQIMREKEQIMLDREQAMLDMEKEFKEEMDFIKSFVSGAGYDTELSEIDKANEMLDKAEMAVLFCIMHRKTGLNLKAHFLSELPDLLPLSDFLLYLNLSYNNLDCFPLEVINLQYLQVLKLRNNPIKSIPGEISDLRDLKFLTMSFNLLTTLPPELFTLPNLQSLDVSYNELEYIPNEIQNLRSLVYLNLEGNLLYSLPCGILKLQLKHLLVENNFLHACFWTETFLMQPQRLRDMAALCFVKHQLWKIYHHLPEEIHDIISNFAGCDCCMGPLYGKGFRFILIYRNVYGLRLPYQFSACSPDCYTAFVKSAVPT